jgi:ATP-dependent Clp protease ATP-binding subunit ClpA
MAKPPTVTKELQNALRTAISEAEALRHEYVTLEHLLLAFLKDAWATKALRACGADVRRLERKLRSFLEDSMERVPEGAPLDVQQTLGVNRVLQRAAIHVLSSEQKSIDVASVLVAMFRESESHALYLLHEEGVQRVDMVNYVSHGTGKHADEAALPERAGEEPADAPRGEEGEEGDEAPRDPLAQYTANLNALAEDRPAHRPRPELERTIQVLCRRRKNNPLSWASPAWARPPSPRASRCASSRARCPTCSRRRDLTPSTWARCSRAPSSAGSSRSASRPCSRP